MAADIVEDLREIVGAQNATDDPAVRFAHTRDQFVKTKGPDYVVLVENTEQISSVEIRL